MRTSGRARLKLNRLSPPRRTIARCSRSKSRACLDVGSCSHAGRSGQLARVWHRFSTGPWPYVTLRVPSAAICTLWPLPVKTGWPSWAKHAELVDDGTCQRLRRRARRQSDEATLVVSRAHVLREALYTVLLDPSNAGPFDAVAQVAEQAAGQARLELKGHEPARWVLAATLELPLLGVANAAADLLCSRQMHHVSRCPGNECGWLFLDRRGRRKWCDMTSCGNRAKARAFAERRSST